MACYSPVLQYMAGEAFPHLKETPPSLSTRMSRHPWLPRSQDKNATSWGVRLSLHGTCGWDAGLACAQGTHKKKSTSGQKKSKKKNPKKKEKSKRKSPQKNKKGKWCRVPLPNRQHPPLKGGLGDLMVLMQSTWGGRERRRVAGFLHQSGNILHSRVSWVT